jgi:hypothetical protein
MNSTFDYMLNTTDATFGYPIDGNRLVQRFMWHSLDDSADSVPPRVENYADSLFSSVTHARQDYGNNWATYVANPIHTEANIPRINLLVRDGQTVPRSYVQPTQPVTFTLRAKIYNTGNTRTTSGGGIQIDFYSGTPTGSHTLINSQTITDVCGCSLAFTLQQTWPITSPTPGAYPWYVQAATQSGESGSDNITTGLAFISSAAGPYLPVVVKGAAS